MMNVLAAIITAIGLVFILALLLAFPTWLLWNLLMPDIFQLPQIGFWQAFGLLLLTGFLFGSRSSSS